MKMGVRQAILDGKTALGVELGSTRIKSVLIDESFNPVASGSHDWENNLQDGLWTYSLDDVWEGLQSSFRSLASDVRERYSVSLTRIGAMGVSAMMHGYLPFDKDGKQLAPFRTWRNTNTDKAASILTEALRFNVPHRWSVAHLFQAMLDGEPHVPDIAYLTTLAGYVHWKLTGKFVLGVNDASGMFPSDGKTNSFDALMLERFRELAKPFGHGWDIADILPAALPAGEAAGRLTAEGAKLLDPKWALEAGIPLCPPEGDAGTGMVATNSVTERAGSVSAGTSIFAMIVLESGLSKAHPEIDVVATPTGKPVAMVHCNNCTCDIDAWVRLFTEVRSLDGAVVDKTALYASLYERALEADPDCGGLLSYNYYSGEPLSGMEEGRPLLARLPDSVFTLANLMRTLLFSSLATLQYGIHILTDAEKVRIDRLQGHGGLFKTTGVGQRFMAAAFNAPVSTMEGSAAEGGAWGCALLASFMLNGAGYSLERFLDEVAFADRAVLKIEPDPKEVESFNAYMRRYTEGLNIEKSAVAHLRRDNG
jgi:sugar (pentulose or hexulose) kinase